jgi:hypothetical protein
MELLLPLEGTKQKAHEGFSYLVNLSALSVFVRQTSFLFFFHTKTPSMGRLTKVFLLSDT